MRKIKATKTFNKDFKRVGFSPALVEVLYCLVKNESIPEKYRDHALSGTLKGFRDCHIKPDLVLIYKINDDNVVELYQLNSHSEVFR